MGPRLLRYSLSLLPLLVACDRATEPSNPLAPPGSEKDLGSAVLQKGASLLQNMSPVGGFDYYLNGFHVMKDHPDLHMEAHHYLRDPLGATCDARSGSDRGEGGSPEEAQ
jgi:hypothetical protein